MFFLFMKPISDRSKIIQQNPIYLKRNEGNEKNLISCIELIFLHLSFKPSSAAAQSRNPRNSPLFLWVHSIAATKSDLNLSANSANLFLSEPLTVRSLRHLCLDPGHYVLGLLDNIVNQLPAGGNITDQTAGLATSKGTAFNVAVHVCHFDFSYTGF
jgi:hypothetical protein